MGKKSKRIKIPKNRDIEEFVEQEESKTEIKTMEEVITQMEKREKEFRDKIKHDTMLKNKKLQNVYARKDAQLAEQKRKEGYLKVINKLQEQEER